MKLNLSKIDDFYHCDLGRYARSRLNDYFEKHLKSKSKICIVSGGGCFYSDVVNEHYDAVVLQYHDDQQKLPEDGAGQFVQMDSNRWPYRAEDIDHVILIHDIEFVQNPEMYLHEAWRVLKGEGTLTVIFPNREGRWAQYDGTPFGKGYPFSLEQMRKVLTRTHFAIDESDGILFFPPYEPKTRIGQLFRSLIDCASGLFFYRPGLYAIKASKHIHAPIGGGLKEMAKNVGRVLQPKPVTATNRNSE